MFGAADKWPRFEADWWLDQWSAIAVCERYKEVICEACRDLPVNLIFSNVFDIFKGSAVDELLGESAGDGQGSRQDETLKRKIRNKHTTNMMESMVNKTE